MTEKFEEMGDLGVDVPITEATRIAKRPSPVERAARPRAKITVVHSPDSRQADTVFALRTDDVRIGRDEALNTFSVNDQDVSRNHLALVWRGDGYRLSDLGSSNGTMVNGAKVATELSLKTNDVILIGSTALKYERAP